jgi:hypothetical protein
VTAQKVTALDPTIFSTWRRDYRLSLALLVTGVVMVVAISVLSLWNPTTTSSSLWTGLAMQVTFTAGGMLILLAGTVAYYHRRGLRLIERNA